MLTLITATFAARMVISCALYSALVFFIVENVELGTWAWFINVLTFSFFMSCFICVVSLFALIWLI